MNEANVKKAVIFDLDGTLWDSTGIMCDLWNNVIARHPELPGPIAHDFLMSLMGKTMDAIAEAAFPTLIKEEQHVMMEEIYLEENSYLADHGAVIYDGLYEMLTELKKNYSLYIVSNCQCGYIEAFLAGHHCEEYFDDIEMFGRTNKEKGDNILLLMERNGITKEHAVYVGDTTGDEDSARYAGIRFIHAAYGFGTAVSPDAVCRQISELPEVVKSVF